MSRSFSILLIVLVTSFILSFNSYSNNESPEKMNDEATAENADVSEDKPQAEEAEAYMDTEEPVAGEPEKIQPDMQDMNSETAEDETVEAEEMPVEQEPEPVKDVLGTVVNIAENAIVVKNERDNRDYTLFSQSSELLQNIEPGYRVEVFYTGNTISDLTVLGTPAEAKPLIIKIN